MPHAEKQAAPAVARTQARNAPFFGAQGQGLFAVQSKEQPAPQPFFAPLVQTRCEACGPEDKLQRQEESEVQAQAENSVGDVLQRQEEEEIQAQAENPSGEHLQRQEEEEIQAQAEEDIQQKTEDQVIEVQPKLSIGAPGDPYEREADAMAERVVNMPEAKANDSLSDNSAQHTSIQRSITPLAAAITPLQRQESPEEAPEVQAQAETGALQLSGAAEPPDDEGEGGIQRQGEKLPSLSERFSQRLSARKGSGSPLPEETRSQMESGFGADFSGVRIHIDSEAVQMSQEAQAQAFTNGNDIYFNAGKFDPASTQGQRLLAHELTHTVQQGASVMRKEVVQREEVDLEDLKKQLAESEKDQRNAIDPSEMRETRNEAIEETQTAEQTAENEVPDVVVQAPAALPAEAEAGSERVAVPVPKKPDLVVPSSKKKEAAPKPAQESAQGADVQQESPNLPEAHGAEAEAEGGSETGEVGQLLEAESADVCNKGAAKAQELADNEQAHDTAEDKTEQTNVAQEPPELEGQSRSNATQVETLEKAEAPKPDDQTIKRERDEAIERALPQKIEQLNEFESKKKAQVVGNQVLESTGKQVGEVQGAFNKIEQAPPPADAEIPVPLPEIEQAPETPTLNLGKGAVPEVPAEHTDMSHFQQEADDIYKTEGITPEMQPEIEKVDSGDIGEANKEKVVLKQKVEEEPANLQTFAKEEQQKVETDLQSEENRARKDMETQRDSGLNAAKDKQQKTKSEMEIKRETETKWINDRYEQAKNFVMPKLAALEKEALAAFDAGQKAASVQFEQNVKRRVNAWKADRYSGFWGAAKWVKDAWTGIDEFPAIKQIFESERAAFVAAIDRLIIEINSRNQKTIEECKQELANAKEEIQGHIAGLDPKLQEDLKNVQAENEKKLADLDKHIDQEKKKLQQKLCDKKDEAIKAIDKKIEAMKAEMSGIVGKLKSLLLGLAKKFFTWAIEKLGGNAEKIIGILDKGAIVLKKLFTDPIGFFGNLIKAVGGGIGRFIDNIGSWLRKGLATWLLGAMGDSGLQLPEKFDFKGILFIGLQVAGLTWQIIRGKVVKALGPNGEKIMAGAEKTVAVIQRVVKEGPIALWHILTEKASEIKESVMSGIRDWAITKIVTKATTKLLTMLNPAGAILQAILLIYDVVMFFIENWERIVDFVGAVFDSIGSIAKGAVGQAAAFIEKALGMAIPMMLSFFARFVGLDGIGKAIRAVIEKIKKPFQTILDKVIKYVVGLLRKGLAVGGKLVGKVKKGAGKIKEKLVEWWKISKSFITKDGKKHKLYSKGNQNNVELMIASTPMSYYQFLETIPVNTENQPLLAEAREVVARFYQIRSERIPDGISADDQERIRNRKRNELIALLEGELWPLTNQLLTMNGGQGHTGDENDRIPIIWFKPHLANGAFYPRIVSQEQDYFDANVGTGQGGLYVPPELQEPSIGHLPGAIMPIGVDGEYKVEKDSKLHRRKDMRSKLTQFYRKVLEYHGVDLSGLQIDHITELNWGGDDVFQNLWPIDANANSSAGNRINQQIVIWKFGTENRALPAGSPHLDNKYFIVTRLED